MLSLARAAVDFFFPPRCPSCRATGGDSNFCPACRTAIRPVRSPLCPRCGLPFAGRGSDHPCDSCRQRPPRFDHARACTLYEAAPDQASPLATALHGFKYYRDVTLAPPLAELLASGCPYENNYDVLVPVPLHLDRLRWRGFNQAALLARPLARRWGIELDPFVLARIRATSPQVGLDEAERRRNVVGAFEVRRRERMKRRKILLVDDVYTTGATVNECARVLKRNGAERVDVLVLARVL